mgnify:CR=1 FL=1
MFQSLPRVGFGLLELSIETLLAVPHLLLVLLDLLLPEVGELLDLLEFKVCARHAAFDVGEAGQDFLRDFVLVVVFDHFEVQLAPHQLQLRVQLYVVQSVLKHLATYPFYEPHYHVSLANQIFAVSLLLRDFF